MKMESAALIGLGAMGVFFAPRMEAGMGRENFCVIAGGQRRKRLETQGVTVNQVNYRFRVVSPEEGEPKDLIIMAVKDTGLEQAIRDIEKFVGENTQILRDERGGERAEGGGGLRLGPCALLLHADSRGAEERNLRL